MSDDEIRQLQDYAVRTDELDLLYDTYTALGFGRRVPILPMEGEVKAARQRCIEASRRLAAAGVQIVE